MVSSIPDRNDRKRFRYEIAMPLVLTMDLDEQFTWDDVTALRRRVMEKEIRIHISGCDSTGCYELYCNVKPEWSPHVPNERPPYPDEHQTPN